MAKKTKAQKIAAKAARSKREMARQWENHQKAMREHPEQFGYTKHENAFIEDLVYEDRDFERSSSKNLYATYMMDGVSGTIQAGIFESSDASPSEHIATIYQEFKAVNPHHVLVIRLNSGITAEEAKKKIYDKSWWRCANEALLHISYNGGAYVKQADFERTVRSLTSRFAA